MIRETLDLDNKKLRKLKMRDDQVLELRSIIKGKPCWVAVCPQPCRNEVIWKAYRVAHSGAAWTLGSNQLDWYWPGIGADVR